MSTLLKFFIIISAVTLSTTKANSLVLAAPNTHTCSPNKATLKNNQKKIISQIKLKAGNSLSQLILNYSGISYSQFIQAIKPKKISKIINQLRVGQTIIAEQNPQSCNLETLKIVLSNHTQIRIIKLADGSFKSFIFNSPKYVKEVYKHFYINSSLYTDGASLNIPYNIILKVEFVLASRFDFSRVLRKGDHFAVMYEETINNQGKIDNGQLLKVVYTRSNGQTTSLYRYLTKKGEIVYADESGRNSEYSFLRNPLKSAKVSSHFNLKRLHPILHKIKAHKGTDFAAQLNTPIRATADGEVIFIGKLQGYGSTIRIKHSKKYKTLYAHLSKFAPNLKLKDTIERGQTIGYVGITGLATGPHLHYEFLVNNKHKDPMRVQLPISQLDKKEMTYFRKHQQRYLQKFQQLRDIRLLAQTE